MADVDVNEVVRSTTQRLYYYLVVDIDNARYIGDRRIMTFDFQFTTQQGRIVYVIRRIWVFAVPGLVLYFMLLTFEWTGLAGRASQIQKLEIDLDSPLTNSLLLPLRTDLRPGTKRLAQLVSFLNLLSLLALFSFLAF